MNTIRIQTQNLRLLAYLLSGKSIRCFSPAKQRLRVGYLNSRISELIHEHKIPINKKWVRVRDANGELTPCVQYSIKK